MAPHHQLLAFDDYFVISVSFVLILSSLYFVKKNSVARKQAQERERAHLAIALSGARDLPEWLPAPSSNSPPPPSLPGGDRKAAASAPAGGGGEGERQKGEERRKKKRRKKKKRQESAGGLEGGEEAKEMGKEGAGKAGSICLFAGKTQRKIKAKYDELLKSNQAKALTVAQVGQFINCLIEARNKLLHKSNINRRRFKIKMALLAKADISSFDHLAQQIYKLEAEHNRLEEDAAVYNLVQEQLKLSPAFNQTVELRSNMELKVTSDQETEATELLNIPFEEFLAREKKDPFWQKKRKLRSSAS